MGGADVDRQDGNGQGVQDDHQEDQPEVSGMPGLIFQLLGDVVGRGNDLPAEGIHEQREYLEREFTLCSVVFFLVETMFWVALMTWIDNGDSSDRGTVGV